MLKIDAIGNIGQDARVRTGNEGRQFLSFSLGVSKPDKTTLWLSVLMPYKAGLQPYLVKGAKVFVRGDADFAIYQGKAVDVTVFAKEVELCDLKKDPATIAGSPIA